jgi:hypothetical protein
MTAATTTRPERNGLPSQAEVQHTVLALSGIFMALNMLVVHREGEQMSDDYVRECIERLVVAGETLADSMCGRM